MPTRDGRLLLSADPRPAAERRGIQRVGARVISGGGATVCPFSKNVAGANAGTVFAEQSQRLLVLALGFLPVVRGPSNPSERHVSANRGKVRPALAVRFDCLRRPASREIEISSSERELRILFCDVSREARVVDTIR